jgi:hypothetical protein
MRFNVVQRQNPLARVPLGVAFLAASTAVVFDSYHVEALLLWIFAGVCFVVYLLLALVAPPWLKPAWLRSAEAHGRHEPQASSAVLTWIVKGGGALVIFALAGALFMQMTPMNGSVRWWRESVCSRTRHRGDGLANRGSDSRQLISADRWPCI